jgi:hypothetical protein
VVAMCCALVRDTPGGSVSMSASASLTMRSNRAWKSFRSSFTAYAPLPRLLSQDNLTMRVFPRTHHLSAVSRTHFY